MTHDRQFEQLTGPLFSEDFGRHVADKTINILRKLEKDGAIRSDIDAEGDLRTLIQTENVEIAVQLLLNSISSVNRKYFGEGTKAFDRWFEIAQESVIAGWDEVGSEEELIQAVISNFKTKYPDVTEDKFELASEFLRDIVRQHFNAEFALGRYDLLYKAADSAETETALPLFQTAVWYKTLAQGKYRIATGYLLQSSLWVVLGNAVAQLSREGAEAMFRGDLILSPTEQDSIIESIATHLQATAPKFTGNSVSYFATDLFSVIDAYDLPEFFERINPPVEKRQRGRARKSASTLPQQVPFTQDKHVYAITSFLSGRSNPTFLPELNSYQLGNVSAGRTKQYEDTYITARVDFILAPDSTDNALDRIVHDRDELKGKVFVGTLGLAKWVAHRDGDPTKFPVSLRDLMKLFFDYELKTKTDSRRYWKAAAQITRYLFVDLPMLEISLQLIHTVGPTKNKPRHYQEVLMRAPGVYAVPGKKVDPSFRETVHRLVAEGNTDELAEYLRLSNVEGFTLGYDRNAMEALGGQALNVASELMTHEVLALTGPSWWLAYRVIAHLRRWQSGKDVKPEKGVLLIEALREPGYLESQHRARVSYKDALRSWLQDIERLVQLGVLEEPGVRVFQFRGRRWVDCSDELDRWVSAGKEMRITEGKLEGIRILYTLPTDRREEMREVRKRGQFLAKSAKARQAANNAVQNVEKSVVKPRKKSAQE